MPTFVGMTKSAAAVPPAAVPPAAVPPAAVPPAAYFNADGASTHHDGENLVLVVKPFAGSNLSASGLLRLIRLEQFRELVGRLLRALDELLLVPVDRVRVEQGLLVVFAEEGDRSGGLIR